MVFLNSKYCSFKYVVLTACILGIAGCAATPAGPRDPYASLKPLTQSSMGYFIAKIQTLLPAGKTIDAAIVNALADTAAKDNSFRIEHSENTIVFRNANTRHSFNRTPQSMGEKISGITIVHMSNQTLETLAYLYRESLLLKSERPIIFELGFMDRLAKEIDPSAGVEVIDNIKSAEILSARDLIKSLGYLPINLLESNGHQIILNHTVDTEKYITRLTAGDELLAIDGTSLDKLSATQIRKLSHGDIGSDAQLTLRDTKGEEYKEIHRREFIGPIPLSVQAINENTVYLAVNNHVRLTPSAIKEALKQVLPNTEKADLVLDLRASSLVTLSTMLNFLGAFLPEQTLFKMQTPDGKTNDYKTPEQDSPFPVDLMAILIDTRSDALSILAASVLQQRLHASIIGWNAKLDVSFHSYTKIGGPRILSYKSGELTPAQEQDKDLLSPVINLCADKIPHSSLYRLNVAFPKEWFTSGNDIDNNCSYGIYRRNDRSDPLLEAAVQVLQKKHEEQPKVAGLW